MSERPCRARLRTIARIACIALGVAAVVGSGGGLGAGFNGFTYQGGGGTAPTAFVTITPSRPTVQAGAIVEFSIYFIYADPPLAYQWRRNGVNIAGATGPTYTLGGATPADDGAVFELEVRSNNGVATGSATLRVSPLPGVVFEDTEFGSTNWNTIVTAQAPQNGPTYAMSTAADGGNPGPYRSIAYQMTPAPSALRLAHTYTAALYDPAVQGLVYTIDVYLDCARVVATAPMANETPTATPIVQQAGRTYVPFAWSATCTTWQGRRNQSLLPQDFEILNGPPCRVGESCPDYTAPLQFGFATELSLSGNSAGGALTQGVDNWKVVVWRR